MNARMAHGRLPRISGEDAVPETYPSRWPIPARIFAAGCGLWGGIKEASKVQGIQSHDHHARAPSPWLKRRKAARRTRTAKQAKSARANGRRAVSERARRRVRTTRGARARPAGGAVRKPCQPLPKLGFVRPTPAAAWPRFSWHASCIFVTLVWHRSEPKDAHAFQPASLRTRSKALRLLPPPRRVDLSSAPPWARSSARSPTRGAVPRYGRRRAARADATLRLPSLGASCGHRCAALRLFPRRTAVQWFRFH